MGIEHRFLNTQGNFGEDNESAEELQQIGVGGLLRVFRGDREDDNSGSIILTIESGVVQGW